MKPTISIIAALSENRALGKNGKLLWHIPQDMKRFKQLTIGHPVIMGRKTYESIGKPLPGRSNIVVTQNSSFTPPGCKIAHSLQEAINIASQQNTEEIFIIGGGNIYQQAIKLADKLYLTLVKGNFEADTFFPDYQEFKKIKSQKNYKDATYEYTFLELTR